MTEGFDFTRQTETIVGAMLSERDWSLGSPVASRRLGLRAGELRQGHGQALEGAAAQHGARPRPDDLQPAPPDPVQVLSADVRRGDEPADRPVPRRRGDVADDVSRPVSRIKAGQRDGRRPAGPQFENCRRRSSRTRYRGDSHERDSLAFKSLDATFLPNGGADAIRTSLEALRVSAEKAVHEGYHVLCISDRSRPDAGSTRSRRCWPSAPSTATCAGRGCATGAAGRPGRRHSGRARHGRPGRLRGRRVHPYLMLRLVKDGLTWKNPETKQEHPPGAARRAAEPLPRPGRLAVEDHLEDGHYDHRGVPRRDAVRGGRLRPGVDGVFRRLPQPRRRHRLWRSSSRTPSGGSRRPRRWPRATSRSGENTDYHAYNAKMRMALRDAVKEAHPEPERWAGGEMAYTAPPAEPRPEPAAPSRS